MTKAMLFIATASLGIVSLNSAPAVAQQDKPEAAEQTEPTVVEQDKVICKRYAPTGSRVKKKFCARASEWARSEAAALKFRTDLQDTVNSEGGGN
ncbi:hypothetical protein [Qipengyuania spongiae]|uniref:Uncharacterized protein n=1 Tax=Qipengyuania spongiae TaxID=2909673 RepID=A0ABY5T1G8_9SPHN|nr:hypothetical protein [Qipengyuania spongiae]UVI38779.1 hypothetical protein L1F33_11055 [Qipengyuania spongiae]